MGNHQGSIVRVPRLVSGLAAAAALMVVQLWAATPAHAGHSVTITHAPPPVAVAGTDVQLVVAVDGCWIFCSPISLQTSYRTEGGRTRTIHQSLGSFGPQAAMVVIPGRHVAKPAFLYFLQARQDYCWFDVCHDAGARLPETGSYSVPVQ
ncbi:MAG: hypothetical protein ABR505_00455 [Actinomycetota bacterium]